MGMNLILIYGPPASGKLTVAKKLATITGYTLLDNHQVTDYLPQLFPSGLPDLEVAGAKLGRKIRLLIFEAAAANNVSLITTFAPLVDGAHDFIRSIKSSVEDAGGKLYLVQLIPNQQALDSRVVGESREGGKAQTVQRLRELADRYPVMFERFPDLEHLVINNSSMQPNEVARLIYEHYSLAKSA